MGVPTSEVGYTSATTGGRDHKVHKKERERENLQGKHDLTLICSIVVMIIASYQQTPDYVVLLLTANTRYL
jgi:hypothetical protein